MCAVILCACCTIQSKLRYKKLKIKYNINNALIEDIKARSFVVRFETEDTLTRIYSKDFKLQILLMSVFMNTCVQANYNCRHQYTR